MLAVSWRWCTLALSTVTSVCRGGTVPAGQQCWLAGSSLLLCAEVCAVQRSYMLRGPGQSTQSDCLWSQYVVSNSIVFPGLVTVDAEWMCKRLVLHRHLFHSLGQVE